MSKMKRLTVVIGGKEAAPAARMLEVLTRSGLLDGRCTWEETPKGVHVHVANPTPEQVKVFDEKPQYMTFVEIEPPNPVMDVTMEYGPVNEDVSYEELLGRQSEDYLNDVSDPRD